jgi:hypothetical protein
MFINCSNHPSNRWGEQQKNSAQKLGGVVDIPFPSVNPHASSETIIELANELVQQIAALSPVAVFVAGEFSLTFAVVFRLQKMGIDCFAACSERRSSEKVLPDGSTKKTIQFNFVQWRKINPPCFFNC